MNSNEMLNILYSMHVQQTSLPNSPFPISIEFNPDSLDKEKYISLSKSQQEFDNFVNLCFDEFKIKHDCPFGSVHLHPDTWTKFALKAIITSWKNKSNIIVFPNGCCSVKNCPINNYYLIVLENITLKN